MTLKSLWFGLLSSAVFAIAACAPAPTHYDLVIENGRVIDPETGFDSIANLGISGGTIAAISDDSLQGTHRIDASGHIVAPGFIDIHSHTPTPLGVAYQSADGVTTQLDLEAGAYPASAYGFMIEGKSPLHYGSSVSHLSARMKVIEGVDAAYIFSETGPTLPGLAFVTPATPEQIEEMRAILQDGIAQGGIGIGVLLDYMSIAVTPAELRMIFEVAAEANVPVTVHVRRGLPGDPAGLIEVIHLAEETGAPLLVCHITHSAMQALPDWLARIDAANAGGARIATETLSYAAGGTSIGAAVFGRDWRAIFDIDFEDVQWTATGEWLTEESFNRYRAEHPSGMINHHYVKEEWMHTALSWPRMMVSSDTTLALTEDVLANPNIGGTFSRFIGHYSRDSGLMDLRQALAQTSLYQAQWLEESTPAFTRKGRLQIGMDADIVVLNLATLQARATYGAPYQTPMGIPHVIVAGTPVIQNGEAVDGAAPGQRLTTLGE